MEIPEDAGGQAAPMSGGLGAADDSDKSVEEGEQHNQVISTKQVGEPWIVICLIPGDRPSLLPEALHSCHLQIKHQVEADPHRTHFKVRPGHLRPEGSGLLVLIFTN